MGKRVLGPMFSCAVGIVVLSGCATGTLNSPGIVTTGPATSTGVTTVTPAQSAVAAARRSASEQSAAQESSADQAASQAAGRPTSDDATTQEAPSSVLSEADAVARGWYDERGWVSPQTAARALAAGIPLGANVPDSLRCGTTCGEDPTSGEIQAQKLAEQESARAQASASGEPCAYMVVRGVCYTTPSAAAAAGE